MEFRIFLSYFFLFCFSTVIAQQNTVAVGKITYESEAVEANSNFRFVEMWFTSSNYCYQFKGIEQTLPKPIIELSKEENIVDSLAKIELMKAIVEERKKIAINQWFNVLGSSIEVYSFFEPASGKRYCVQDTIKFVEWQLESDTMTIRGMRCQKASGKFNNIRYIAWFAPQIPISAAPFKYRGLPGLLIECNNITNNTKFGMVELAWPLKEAVILDSCNEQSIFVTRNELQEIIEKQNTKGRKLAEIIEKAKKEEKVLNIKDILKE